MTPEEKVFVKSQLLKAKQAVEQAKKDSKALREAGMLDAAVAADLKIADIERRIKAAEGFTVR